MLGVPWEWPRAASLGLIVGSEGVHRKMHTYSKQNGSGASRCSFAIYIKPFPPFRAGDVGLMGTAAEAYVSLRALVV